LAVERNYLAKMGSGASNTNSRAPSQLSTNPSSKYSQLSKSNSSGLGHSLPTGNSHVKDNGVSNKSDASSVASNKSNSSDKPGHMTSSSGNNKNPSGSLYPAKAGFSSKQSELKSISAMDSFRRKRLHTNNDDDSDNEPDNLESKGNKARLNKEKNGQLETAAGYVAEELMSLHSKWILVCCRHVIEAHTKAMLISALNESLHLDRSMPTYNLLVDTLLRFVRFS
jgi:hypothetical protein